MTRTEPQAPEVPERKTVENHTDLELFGRILPLAPSAQPVSRRCRICGARYPKPPALEYTLCAACVADAPGALSVVEAQLARVRLEERAAVEAWAGHQAALEDGLSERWVRLCAVRAQTEWKLERALRGARKSGAVVASSDVARAELESVRAKIARTGRADADIAALLERDQAHRALMQALLEDRARWEMARSDLEVLNGGDL